MSYRGCLGLTVWLRFELCHDVRARELLYGGLFILD